MPPNTLLCAYLDDKDRRAFVDSSSEVKVKRGEVIMRQGACHAAAAELHRTPAGAMSARRHGNA
eukprot:scaffold27829_cov119-Isochrysis_galbana.AAC.3